MRAFKVPSKRLGVQEARKRRRLSASAALRSFGEERQAAFGCHFTAERLENPLETAPIRLFHSSKDAFAAFHRLLTLLLAGDQRGASLLAGRLPAGPGRLDPTGGRVHAAGAGRERRRGLRRLPGTEHEAQRPGAGHRGAGGDGRHSHGLDPAAGAVPGRRGEGGAEGERRGLKAAGGELPGAGLADTDLSTWTRCRGRCETCIRFFILCEFGIMQPNNYLN